MQHPDPQAPNPVFGQPDARTLAQFRDVLGRAFRGALMADGHVGYVMPIGGVAAYENRVSVVGVGFDIGCGNMAAALDVRACDLDVDRALDLIERHVAFGVGQTNPDAPADGPVFHLPEWDAYPTRAVAEAMRSLARGQLGTVGGGNHYVDLFEDETGRAWVGVHFGSRGLGHKTAGGFINLSLGRPWDARPGEKEVLLDLGTDLGERYFRAMTLAGRYAFCGREWVCRTVARVLGAGIVQEVHNHHNFAWRERHFGRDLVVVRKGATPAFPGQTGFVGGSMGDPAVILEGVEGPLSRQALYSTVHGAGRVMSRTQAAGRFSGWGRNRRRVAPELVSRAMRDEWLARAGVKLRGGGLDEAPQAYRRLSGVLEAQGPTVRVLHTLRPLGVVMAGEDTADPYRD